MYIYPGLKYSLIHLSSSSPNPFYATYCQGDRTFFLFSIFLLSFYSISSISLNPSFPHFLSSFLLIAQFSLFVLCFHILCLCHSLILYIQFVFPFSISLRPLLPLFCYSFVWLHFPVIFSLLFTYSAYIIFSSVLFYLLSPLQDLPTSSNVFMNAARFIQFICCRF